MYLCINRCPRHGAWSISIDGVHGGLRVTPAKCCGYWTTTKRFELSPDEWRALAKEAESAAQSVASAQPVKAGRHAVTREKAIAQLHAELVRLRGKKISREDFVRLLTWATQLSGLPPHAVAAQLGRRERTVARWLRGEGRLPSEEVRWFTLAILTRKL